ncbi:MAG: acetyl-CoA carboxylase biotin carboxyl carrier protein [Bacillota bacterium]|nr:acetyl-CoA carboxylase biotin carboxyl carrier protein [Bacillota bacterium]
MDIKRIKALIQLVDESGLSVLDVSEGETKIRIEKAYCQQPVQAAVPSYAPQIQNVSRDKSGSGYKEIKSPVVGVFYSAPSEDAEPYVGVGDKVKKGDVLCIIEAMKLMNEILAEEDGEITEICAENGQVVEYGQTIFRLS